MKPPQFFITLILSAVCVVLSLITIWQGRSLNDLQNKFQEAQVKDQNEFQGLQQDINKGMQMQQAYTNIIKEIAAAAYDQTGKVKDEKLKELLAKNGWSLTPNAAPAPAATPKSANP